MADLSITATNVDWTSGKNMKMVRFGSTVTRGMSVYLDDADNEWKVADANADMTGLAEDHIGVAMSDGSDGKLGLVALDGATINIGATTTAGIEYVVTSTDALTANGTAGGIVAASAIGSGDTPVRLFWGTGSGAVILTIDVSANAIA